MDDDKLSSPQAAPAHGGTVEPANRAAVAKEMFQTPRDVPAERYELRDPFAEVTYRSTHFLEIAAKADQLGSERIVSIDVQGKRSTVRKVDGEWDWVPHRNSPPGPAPSREAQSHVTEKAPTPPVKEAKPDIPVAPTASIEARAERAALVARLQAELRERYLIKRPPLSLGTMPVGSREYRFRGDSSRVAFTESTFRLSTDTNSPTVARSMVDVAQARQWQGLRVTGNEEFRRLVWLEATVRGVKALGYTPLPADLQQVQKEREARQVNRIEPLQGTEAATDKATKASERGGGRKAVLAAIEAVLLDRKVPEPYRQAVMAAASEKLAERLRQGPPPPVKVWDATAPSQRPARMPVPDISRTRERAAPAR